MASYESEEAVYFSHIDHSGLGYFSTFTEYYLHSHVSHWRRRVCLIGVGYPYFKEGVDRFERNDKESYPGEGIWVHQCRRWERDLFPPLRF